MRAAANAFESVKGACGGQGRIFDVRAAFFDQIGRADPERLVPLLARLRSGWEKAASARSVADVQQAFVRDPGHGWQTWLDLYADSLHDRSWWKSLGCELAAALRSSPTPD